MKNFSISVIVTTYNRPDALGMVLKALAQQTDQSFEVIIADDGSKAETLKIISQLKETLNYTLRHCWQADLGFRAAKCRNRAASLAKGEYLIFIDGDCIPPKNFIARHRNLAEAGWFVVGNRILLSKEFSPKVIEQNIPVSQWSTGRWLFSKLKGQCNRYLPIIKFPLGKLRKIKPSRWKGAKTCNLGLWKMDLLQINGFDEAYQGWGYEDSDLVIRLMNAGIYRKSGHFAAPVFHLWHPENDRLNTENNLKRLHALQHSKTTQPSLGIKK